jgi:hypothetical protein
MGNAGVPPCLPPSLDILQRSLEPMPYYRNCFVCGVDRFTRGCSGHFTSSGRAGPAGSWSPGRASMGRTGTRCCASREGPGAPVVLLALVDETMGWEAS